MKTITIYSENSRIIDRVVSCPVDFVDIQLGEGERFIEGWYEGKDYYIEEGTPRKKQENPSTLIGTTLENVPESSTITVDGRQYPASGTVELDFTPGTYRIRIDSPAQYKPKELTVEINP